MKGSYLTNGTKQRVNHLNPSLQLFAASCNYHKDSQDSILRDHIVLGIREQETQKLLLREPKLMLDLCVNICKAAENANTQGKILRPDSGAVPSIEKICGSQHRSTSKQTPWKTSAKSKPSSENSKTLFTTPGKRECNYCGLTHVMRKANCPAWGRTCSNCKGKNNFKAKCKKTKVHTDAYLANGQMDTGADVNTVRDLFIRNKFIQLK